MKKTVEIKSIKANPINPRVIKDSKFKKLVKSIQEFPQMLEIRPIVVNSDMMILGGNQRLKAAQEAGLKEIPIYIASELNDGQQKEFIIKDNVSSGDWDWELINNQWQDLDLNDWGMDSFISNNDLDGFETDLVEEKSLKNASATDEGYSAFELVMLYENKIELMRILNAVRTKNDIEKIEDALMVVVKNYKI